MPLIQLIKNLLEQYKYLGGWMLVAVLSDKPELREQFCKMVGKESSKDDIAFYSAESVTLIDPLLYPEKIQPLLYCLSMADYSVLIVDALTPRIGEIIVALNAMKMDRGLVVSKVPLPLAGTSLEKFEKVADLETAKAKMLSAKAAEPGTVLIALVDRMEAVKAIGNVVHGIVKSGSVKVHDKLFLLPEKKDVEVRSIRVDGKDVAEATSGQRFSLAYKGEPVGRGILVPIRHEFEIGNIINGRFSKSVFFKDELKGKIHAYANMQYVEGNMSENDLTLSGEMAYEKGELILVVDASNQKLRIAGPFQSKW